MLLAVLTGALVSPFYKRKVHPENVEGTNLGYLTPASNYHFYCTIQTLISACNLFFRFRLPHQVVWWSTGLCPSRVQRGLAVLASDLVSRIFTLSLHVTLAYKT